MLLNAREHYNYFRDYDPAIGRYIESDPIGLDAGFNTYAYVAANPLWAIDPLGLLGRGGAGGKPGAGRVMNDFRPCGYYDDMCAKTGCFYYCVTGPLVCRNAQSAPFHFSYFGASKLNCVRNCLVGEDKKRHDERDRKPVCFRDKCLSNDDINSYHDKCFETCGVPKWTYPGVGPFNWPSN